MKLKNKKYIDFKGTVHDLCVSNSHTYNVAGLGVHNSGGGSLVNYSLGITELDPVYWDLPFARFLSVHRCLDPELYVLSTGTTHTKLKNIQIGDDIISALGNQCQITDKISTFHKETVTIDVGGKQYVCSKMHKWFVAALDKSPIEMYAKDLVPGDKLFMYDMSCVAPIMEFANIQIIKNTVTTEHDTPVELIDITVQSDSSFWISHDQTSWHASHNSGAPDIDTDISNRDKVLDQLREFFGPNNVVPISNYNRFALKSLIKDLAKFHNVEFEEVNAATRTVEQDVRRATMKKGEDKNLFVLTYEDSIKHSPSFAAFIDKYPRIADSVKVLFKQNRSLGKHAGGVLICDDLPNKMPLITSKGVPQSPWVEGVNHKHLEKVGSFIKYDILGLETLRLIERTIELILRKRIKNEGCRVIELDNGKTVKLFPGDKVETTNRGAILVKELVDGDDIIVS